MKQYEKPKNFMNFGGDIDRLNGKKHLINALSTTFSTHGKQCWENSFLKGKMDTKSKNLHVLESRRKSISNKPSCS